MGAPCRGDHAGTSVMAGDLTDGEKSPVRGPRYRGQRGLTDGVTLSVVGYLKMNFFYFAELFK